MGINKKLLLAGVVGLTALASFGNNAYAVDVTGNASAFINEVITITENNAMDFATVLADPAGDTVTLTPAAGISATGSSTFSGTPVAGEFAVVGTPNAALTISFSSGDVLTGPGVDMPLNTFTHDAGANPALDGSGDLTLNVGANLDINASQVGGAYSGTYTLTVEYQ